MISLSPPSFRTFALGKAGAPPGTEAGGLYESEGECPMNETVENEDPSRAADREPAILGSPQRSALPLARVRNFKIVREVAVLALVERLRESASDLRTAMGRWCDAPKQDLRGRMTGEMLKWSRFRKDGFIEKRILTDEKVVACWSGLCAQMTHLRIRDFGGMPFTMFGEHLGGEAHIDISQGDIECDGSAEALVERMMLRHASNQLWLAWHALYSKERLYVSKEDYGKRAGRFGLTSFVRSPRDSSLSVRAGYAESGDPVFEFVTDTEYGGDAGVYRWRALRDDSDGFGVARGIIRKFPLNGRVIIML